MKLPILGRKADRTELVEARPAIPANVRAVGWFWLAGVPIGFVSGIVEIVQSLRAGGLSVAVPVSIGVSGWAIGRGLLTGSRRAWRWARRIAGAVTLVTTVLIVLMLVTRPDNLQLEMPWGSRAAERWQAILLLTAMAVLGAWQFLSLNSAAARRVFDPPENADP